MNHKPQPGQLPPQEIQPRENNAQRQQQQQQGDGSRPDPQRKPGQPGQDTPRTPPRQQR